LLARQREIVEELRRDGHRTSEALRLLDIFEDVQRMNRAPICGGYSDIGAARRW
jgi:hypothetical protein